MKKITVVIILLLLAVVAIGLMNIRGKPKVSEVQIDIPALEDEPKIEFEPLLQKEDFETPIVTEKEPLKKSDFQLEAITFEDEPSSNLGEIL